MNRAEVVEELRKFNLSANKKLGQNFLVNDNLIKKIFDSLKVDNGTRVLEIGPGLGAVTDHLVKQAGQVTAVEIDSGLSGYLRDRFRDLSNFTLIHADFLKTEVGGNFDLVVSNLPYYCASEILFRLAVSRIAPEVFVMVQKEVADRIISKPGSKNYSSITVNLDIYFKTEILFDIDRNSFFPRPDVRSSFLRLILKEPVLDKISTEIFHAVVKSAFWGRRKTIIKSLAESPHLNLSRGQVSDILINAGINSNLRGEDIPVDDFIKIAELVNGNR